MKKIAIIYLMITGYVSVAQQPEVFNKLTSIKNKYSVEVPAAFNSRPIVGANVEYSYDNSDHATIVMVVKACPSCYENDLVEMANLSYADQVKIMEENGQENVVFAKAIFTTINGKKTFAQYYTDRTVGITVYCESFTQIKEGKIYSLSLTCPDILKAKYMSYFFRIKNSLKHHQ